MPSCPEATSPSSRVATDWVWTPEHETWPARLSTIASPPERLRVRGRLPAPPGIEHTRPARAAGIPRAVAVVGTRKATAQALAFTESLAHDLVQLGCVVVSGGALGIDAAAHQGALRAARTGRAHNPCPTIAVLASGFRSVYPKEHHDLFEHIVQAGGGLVTETSDEHPFPKRAWFLRRNWLIAAMTEAVVVVQAPVRSGALHTARIATKLGIAVLYVPDSPLEPRARGSNQMLLGGARICLSAQDVLTVAAIAPMHSGPMIASANTLADTSTPPHAESVHSEPRACSPKLPAAGFAALLASLPADEARVLRAMQSDACDADVLAARTNLPMSAVQSILTRLLCGDHIQETRSGKYLASAYQGDTRTTSRSITTTTHLESLKGTPRGKENTPHR